MSEGLAQLNTRIPKSLYKRFKEKAEAEEKTISKVLIRLIESYVEGDDSNEIADASNWEQKLDERLAMALEPIWEALDQNLEGVSCSLPENQKKEAPKDEPVRFSVSDLGINQLANFYGCSTDTLNKLIRRKTGGKKGDQFSYKGVAWEITALNPRKFRQLKV